MCKVNEYIKIGQLFTSMLVDSKITIYTVDKLMIVYMDPISNTPIFSRVHSLKNATHIYNKKHNLCFRLDAVQLIHDN